MADPVVNRPSTSRVTARKKTTNYVWKKRPFITPDLSFSGATSQPLDSSDVPTPLTYFRKFISDDMLEMLCDQTNLYSVQKTTVSVNTTKKEIEQVIGMFFHMGLVRMSGVRQYWESETAYEPVCSVMSRNRFQLLLTRLHFINNLEVSDADKKKDKLWKIRPWLSSLRGNCLKIRPEEYHAVDEMMCQYRGKTSPIRQYIKSKPHPWGFKIWGRAGMDGFLYDFDVYQGGDGTRSELGQGADVVLSLTSTLEKNCNYKIYADNLFTSLPLISKLQEDGFFYTGTVRQNRLPNCSLDNEKEMKKRGRGSHDFKVETSTGVAAVRWFDNRAVTLMSNQTGLEPMTTAKRWSKATKKYEEVPMPAIVGEYNKHMGGIDLLDSFLAQYRFKMRSRRWYLYLFWHGVMIGIVNAWNLYRREYASSGLPAKEMLNRRRFQASVASALTLVNTARKRGRPSVAETAAAAKAPKKAPCDDIRTDQYAHWPDKIAQRGRCKHCSSNKTNTVCTKCNVRLCFVEERNCFKAFHHCK